MNANQLQQDHPCVIRMIQQYYLYPPAELESPYYLDNDLNPDPSDGMQATDIMLYLKKKVTFKLCSSTPAIRLNENSCHGCIRKRDFSSNVAQPMAST